MNTALKIYSPLHRYTVGYDNILDLLGRSDDNKYPFRDVLKTKDDGRQIRVAVAGFTTDELEVTVEGNVLKISGTVQEQEKEEDVEYLYQGISKRDFHLEWKLNHYEVDSATCENGLLIVNLRKEVPEELKPRRIAIK